MDDGSAASLLDGLPDLAALGGAGRPVIAAFRRPVEFGLPTALTIARRTDGTPWLHLTVARREASLDGVALLEVAVELSGAPEGFPVAWDRAMVHVRVQGVEGLAAEDVFLVGDVQPIGAVAWRALIELPIASALVLDHHLRNRTIGMLAGGAELGITCVARRVDAEVRFDPHALLGALVAVADGRRRVSAHQYERTMRALVESGTVVIVSGEGSDGPSDGIAAALGDRVAHRWTSMAPPDHDGDDATLVLHDEDVVAGSSIVWNLAAPALARHVHRLAFDAVTTQEMLVDPATDPTTLISTTTIPRMDVGLRAVSVADNLPDEIAGIEDLRVRLTVPPSPPFRRRAQTSDVVLLPAGSARDTVLRPGAGLPDQYTWRVIALTPGAPEPLEGPEQSSTGDRVFVRPDNVPLRFARVSAAAQVLDLASVVGRAAGMDPEGRAIEAVAFMLDREHPSVTVALPTELAGTDWIDMELCSIDGTSRLALPRAVFRSLRVDFSAIPDVGSHTVVVELSPQVGITAVAVELVPDDAFSPSGSDVLLLTAAEPRRTWSYVATDPFRSGFRYRRLQPGAVEQDAWIGPLRPGDVVVLDEGEVMQP